MVETKQTILVVVVANLTIEDRLVGRQEELSVKYGRPVSRRACIYLDRCTVPVLCVCGMLVCGLVSVSMTTRPRRQTATKDELNIAVDTIRSTSWRHLVVFHFGLLLVAHHLPYHHIILFDAAQCQSSEKIRNRQEKKRKEKESLWISRRRRVFR